MPRKQVYVERTVKGLRLGPADYRGASVFMLCEAWSTPSLAAIQWARGCLSCLSKPLATAWAPSLPGVVPLTKLSEDHQNSSTSGVLDPSSFPHLLLATLGIRFCDAHLTEEETGLEEEHVCSRCRLAVPTPCS